MNLYICDDNVAFSEKLRADITVINPNVKITFFPTISSLMFALEDNGNDIDGIFLDIENADGNGIDAAIKIRQRFPLIKLVFVTGHGDEYSQDIFDCPVGTEPVAFLLKPVSEKYLRKALEKIQSASETHEKYITVTHNRITEFVNENSIIYISNDKRKLTVHTAEKSYTYYRKIETLLSELSEKFCRCHRSYIVNLEYIISAEKWNCVKMNEGTIIPIGKTYLDNFKRNLIAYKASGRQGEQ